jgi:hypothetical protein
MLAGEVMLAVGMLTGGMLMLAGEAMLTGGMLMLTRHGNSIVAGRKQRKLRGVCRYVVCFEKQTKMA